MMSYGVALLNVLSVVDAPTWRVVEFDGCSMHMGINECFLVQISMFLFLGIILQLQGKLCRTFPREKKKPSQNYLLSKSFISRHDCMRPFWVVTDSILIQGVLSAGQEDF